MYKINKYQLLNNKYIQDLTKAGHKFNTQNVVVNLFLDPFMKLLSCWFNEGGKRRKNFI